MNQLIYQKFGGIRKGQSFWFAVNATWPLAKIEIFHEEIIIKYLLFKKIKFLKEEIDYIEKFQGVLGPFGRGIRIFHNKNSESPFIVFWSFSVKKLIDKLKEANYKIK